MRNRDRTAGDNLAGALDSMLGLHSAVFRRWMEDGQAQLNGAAFRESFSVWHELWRSLSSSDPTQELFLRHTYLAVAARLIAASFLAQTDGTTLSAALSYVPSSVWFESKGILGFGREPDLFSWPTSCDVLTDMVAALGKLDLLNVQADVLKPLHHALTARATRKGLGELYTPDWLAEWIVETALAEQPSATLLDPACGSGTFLFFAIRHMRGSEGACPESPEQILKRVEGADVNPLAAELARANLLLAVGPLIASRKDPIRLPVFERDALGSGPMDRRFALIVGNPPWVPLRSVPLERQDRLKCMAAAYGLTDGRSELVTHLDLSTLFFVHCAKSALEEGGRIAFVLPRTVLNADQHHLLRTGSSDLSVARIMDLEGVGHLFPTPAAVLFAHKCNGTAGSDSSVRLERLSGRVPTTDLPLARARELLTVQSGIACLHRAGDRSWWSASNEEARFELPSPYKAHFRQGATLVPRSFWFVDVRDRDGSALCRVASSSQGRSGPVGAYRDVRMQGDVENGFLFATVLGDDLLPFAARKVRTVVLPALVENGALCPLDSEGLASRGRHGMAAWMCRAEAEWKRVRGDKAERMTLVQRLDRVRGLSAQRMSARWRVLYPNFQRMGLASVVDAQRAAQGRTGFIVDTALYGCETDDEAEAHYLCALLNSRPLDDLLQPLRRRAQAAHPNVHKKIFDVAPIPLFDSDDPLHVLISELGAASAECIRCRMQIGDPTLRSTLAIARRAARELVAKELAEIDRAVAELFDRAPRITRNENANRSPTGTNH